MFGQTLYRRGRNTRLVLVVLVCSLGLGWTLAGCGGSCSAAIVPDTLDIILEGTKPRAYTLEASVPGGQTYTVECRPDSLGPVPGGGVYGSCRDTGVTFYNFTPSETTITLVWDNHRISQTFTPTFATTWPDNEPCQKFRYGKVSLPIP